MDSFFIRLLHARQSSEDYLAYYAVTTHRLGRQINTWTKQVIFTSSDFRLSYLKARERDRVAGNDLANSVSGVSSLVQCCGRGVCWTSRVFTVFGVAISRNIGITGGRQSIVAEAFTSDITVEFLARRKQETAESRWNSGKEVNTNFAELVFYPVHGELREINQKRAYEEKRSCIYLTELWIFIE